MTVKKPRNSDHKVPKIEELGCKFADKYLAVKWGITIKEAQKKYTCGGNETLPECPFGELSGCLEDASPPKNWKLGYAAGKLSAIPKSAKRTLFNINEKTYSECSSCKYHRQIEELEYYPPNYCWNCGAKFV